MRQSFQESRFKVVNCHRTFEPNAESISTGSRITIVDIEEHKGETGAGEEATAVNSETTPMQSFVPTDDNAVDGFVYDLYVPDHDHQLPDNVDYMEPYIRFVYHVDQILLTNRHYIWNMFNSSFIFIATKPVSVLSAQTKPNIYFFQKPDSLS